MIQRLSLLILFLLGFAGVSALAEPTIDPSKLLLLVAGPSGDRIDPQEKAVVEHLNGLRKEYNFSQFQMGTMHYDRPQEAALLKNTLGFSPQKGVTVGLVQLSDQGIPVRTLYKMESVTQAKILSAQNDLLSRWSRTTGQPLPPGLRPQAQNPTAPPVASNLPRPTQPTGATDPWMAQPTTGQTVYTEEGIRTVITALDDQVAALWGQLRNAPLREDGNDLVLREQTKALAEATAALRAKSDSGVILPLAEVLAVAQYGRAWNSAEPQYFLPVPMRGEVKPLGGLLHMIDEIAAQGTRLNQSAP